MANRKPHREQPKGPTRNGGQNIVVIGNMLGGGDVEPGQTRKSA